MNIRKLKLKWDSNQNLTDKELQLLWENKNMVKGS